MDLRLVATMVLLCSSPGCFMLNPDRRFPDLGHEHVVLMSDFNKAERMGPEPGTERGGRPTWSFEIALANGKRVQAKAGPQTHCVCSDRMQLRFADEPTPRVLWRYHDCSGVSRISVSPAAAAIYFVTWSRRPWQLDKRRRL